MDKPEVRIKFKENINKFLPLVSLNTMFMKLLESHSCATDLFETLNKKKSSDQKAKKLIIFTEFNLNSNSCKELVEILNNCDQEGAAKMLEQYNQSTTPIVYSSDVEIKVKPAQTFRSGASRTFVMKGNPRGRALIFLQLDELKNEADRFDHTFKQLYFSVDIYVKYSCDQILDTLKKTSQQEFEMNALIVMFIGHGHDGIIQGSGHGQDEIQIKKLVDQFTDQICHPTYNLKAKIFLFSCCQTFDIQDVRHSAEWDWMDDTTRTYILYAWAQGIHAIDANGYTLFGQVFSHCIANYACEYNLKKIFTKTDEEINWVDIPERPELTMKTVDRELYFNPGLLK